MKKLGYRTIYRVHMGREPLAFHSYRDFDELLDACAFMWAMAHVNSPERCWLWQGLDGWLRNDHMKGMPMPPSIKFKIEEFIAEDNLSGADYA